MVCRPISLRSKYFDQFDCCFFLLLKYSRFIHSIGLGAQQLIISKHRHHELSCGAALFSFLRDSVYDVRRLHVYDMAAIKLILVRAVNAHFECKDTCTVMQVCHRLPFSKVYNGMSSEAGLRPPKYEECWGFGCRDWWISRKAVDSLVLGYNTYWGTNSEGCAERDRSLHQTINIFLCLDADKQVLDFEESDHKVI